MKLLVLPNFLSAILILAVGLLATLKKRKSKVNFMFFLLTVTAFIWQFGTGLALFANNPTHALIATRIAFLGIALIPIFSYHLTLDILGEKTNRLLVFGYSCAVLLFIPLSWTPLILDGVNVYPWGFFFKAGRFHPVFMVFFIYFMLLVFSKLFLSYRKETNSLEKHRRKYFLIALLIAYVGSIDYLPTYGIEVYPFGYLTLICFIVIFAYAIIRYRLMDINFVLTRAGVFAAVYAFILGIPFLLGYKYGLWKHSIWAMLILATAGPFMYNYLGSRAEEIIFKEQRKYQKALRELSRSMTRMRDLGQLLKTIAFVIVDKVKVNSLAIYLKDEEYRCFKLKEFYPADQKSKFDGSIQPNSPLIDVLTKLKRPIIGEELRSENIMSLDAGLIVPLFIEDDLLGFLAVGSKPNNLIYTLEDILVFETLSYSTSLAIENCIFWKEIEDRHRKARLQEMDTYSYSLAHEIDNPMHIILNETLFMKKYLLKHIQDPKDLKDAESAINYTIEASQRVSGMVKAIREFGQKTTGELKPLKVEDVIESFHRLYHPQLKENRVVFEKDIAQGLSYIRGEKPELMQVLVIFANNSLHAMKQLPAKKLFLKAELSSPDTVRITLSDNGYGIKSENLQIIFTPFTTTKASSEGTGMGLYNAKKIVERHKGKIWAESQGEGKGASLCFELPIARDVTEEELKKEDTKVKRLI